MHSSKRKFILTSILVNDFMKYPCIFGQKISTHNVDYRTLDVLNKIYII